MHKTESALTPDAGRPSFLQFFEDSRIAIGFGLVPGLVKALPDRLEEIVSWLRNGLASDDIARVERAMTALQLRVSKQQAAPMPAVPDELLREVGTIIAYRHSDALQSALWVASSIFDLGTIEHQNTIRHLVLEGLKNLAVALRYGGRTYDENDITTLRVLCVQLAISMARAGYGNEPAVIVWITIGDEDPFAEIRNAVILSRAEQKHASGAE